MTTHIEAAEAALHAYKGVCALVTEMGWRIEEVEHGRGFSLVTYEVPNRFVAQLNLVEMWVRVHIVLAPHSNAAPFQDGLEIELTFNGWHGDNRWTGKGQEGQGEHSRPICFAPYLGKHPINLARAHAIIGIMAAYHPN